MSVNHEAGRTCIVKRGTDRGAHTADQCMASGKLPPHPPLSVLILKLNSTRNAIMEPRECEGSKRAKKDRGLERKEETGVITDPPLTTVTLRARPADDQACLVPLPAGPVPVGWHNSRSKPEGTRPLDSSPAFLHLASSASPTTPLSSHWNRNGKYLASDTIGSLQ